MWCMACTCRWGPEQLPDVWGDNQWLAHSPEGVCRCCPDCNRLGPPLPCLSKAWPAAESSLGQARVGDQVTERLKKVQWNNSYPIFFLLIWSLCYFLRSPLKNYFGKYILTQHWWIVYIVSRSFYLFLLIIIHYSHLMWQICFQFVCIHSMYTFHKANLIFFN